MELVFVRHGEADHSLDLPRSLQIVDPRLTERGRQQVRRLREVLEPHDDDLIVISPTRRTIETALILREGRTARAFVSPAAGPRIFPGSPTPSPLPCDTLLSVEDVERDYPELILRDRELWSGGINTIARERFEPIGSDLIEWCRAQQPRRAIMVAHDGTIHSYRRLLGESELTRASFLGLAASYRVTV